MKKTIKSLAALMMLMAAPFMTSCSNDLDEVVPVEEQSNVVTITLNVEQQPETRVGLDTDLKLTGWAQGDKVMLYKNNSTSMWAGSLDGEGVEFECTNASSGTFSGTLPTGKLLSDYNLAVYGGTAEVVVIANNNKELALRPKKYVSTSIDDLVVLAGTFNGTSATLKIVNNIIKLDNASGAEVAATWYMPEQCSYRDYFTWVLPNGSIDSNIFETDYENCPHYTIPTGECYLYMPPTRGSSSFPLKLTLRTADEKNVLPTKEFTSITTGKLFKGGTFNGTTRD